MNLDVETKVSILTSSTPDSLCPN